MIWFNWFLSNKIARTVRLGPSAIFISNKNIKVVAPPEQIQQIKKFGGFTLVKVRDQSFLVFGPQKEPVVARLLENRQRLPGVNRKAP